MVSKKILPIIVIAQFFCSSSWFAVNAVIENFTSNIGVSQNFLANATIAVQLGFITGTLVFAMLSISDRFSPSKVFFISSLFVSLLNLMLLISNITQFGILLSRFGVGFFLAGIYPVGMKIASDYYEKGLGKSLGYLVGALVLGTAFPHFIKSFSLAFSWQVVVYTTSLLTLIGGTFLVLFVPDGPYKKTGQKINLLSMFDGFKNKEFKAAAFGYVGHMWELFSFWAFVPLMIKYHITTNEIEQINIPLISFFAIASGTVGCVAAGYLSQYFPEKKIAGIALILSCLCCVISPFVLGSNATLFTVAFLMFWGMFVITDSPLFSTLVARFAPEATKGTAITFVNCIGFAITIVSIKTINYLSQFIAEQYLYMLLCIGPIIGLISLFKNKKDDTKENVLSNN